MDKLWIFLTFQGFSFWVCRSPAGGCPEGGSEQCGAPWGPRLTIAKLVQIISNNCIIPIYLLMVLWLEDLGSVVNGGCKQLVTGEPLNVSKKGVTVGHKNLCIYPFPHFFSGLLWAILSSWSHVVFEFDRSEFFLARRSLSESSIVGDSLYNLYRCLQSVL